MSLAFLVHKERAVGNGLQPRNWADCFQESNERKTQGWYFRYSQQAFPLAVGEVTSTHLKAKQCFGKLTDVEMETLLTEATEFNFKRYMKSSAKQRNKKKRT